MCRAVTDDVPGIMAVVPAAWRDTYDGSATLRISPDLAKWMQRLNQVGEVGAPTPADIAFWEEWADDTDGGIRS